MRSSTHSPGSVVVVADSSGLVSLLHPFDANQGRATQLIQQFQGVRGAVVVPSDVFTETINVMGKKFTHAAALQAAETILRSRVFVITESVPLLDPALKKFQHQAGSVSFTDCVVMAMADSYKCREIFGFDEVFRNNGYRLPEVNDQEAAA